ncbi:unnamed protein product [Boreogadus saida]
MLMYREQERTRPFPGPLFQKQDNPGTYYLDQGLRHSVSLVCIQSTAPAPLPATDPLPSNAPLPTVTETFLKDHTLYLIDLMRLQLEAEGRGPPRSLQDLIQRLKLARNSKKLLWEEIAGKLTDHFKCTFPPDKFFSEMDDLMGGHHDLMGGHHDIVFPVVGTAMGLDVRRPATTMPPANTPRRPRKRQREEDLLTFLRESEAASQAAAQKRHAETLAQMKEAQEGLQSLLGQMVVKM